MVHSFFQYFYFFSLSISDEMVLTAQHNKAQTTTMKKICFSCYFPFLHESRKRKTTMKKKYQKLETHWDLIEFISVVPFQLSSIFMNKFPFISSHSHSHHIYWRMLLKLDVFQSKTYSDVMLMITNNLLNSNFYYGKRYSLIYKDYYHLFLTLQS